MAETWTPVRPSARRGISPGPVPAPRAAAEAPGAPAPAPRPTAAPSIPTLCGNRRRLGSGPWIALESEPTPGRLARVDELQLDRRNSEERNHGRSRGALLDAVIVRRPGDAPDESAARNRDRSLRVEVRAAVHPPRTRQHQREPIGRVRMGSAEV